MRSVEEPLVEDDGEEDCWYDCDPFTLPRWWSWGEVVGAEGDVEMTRTIGEEEEAICDACMHTTTAVLEKDKRGVMTTMCVCVCVCVCCVCVVCVLCVLCVFVYTCDD